MTTIAQDVIESLSSFEEIADAARLVATDLDSGRFTLGDIANRCARVHGQDSIGKLATEIRVAKRQTLYEYAKVAARFDLSARAEFTSLGLTFSHFREALRAGDQAVEWLAQAADNGWPVAELARQIAAAIGKRVPPKLLYEGEASVEWYDGLRLITLWADTQITGIHWDGDPPGEGQRVLVKVYQLTDAGQMVEGAE